MKQVKVLSILQPWASLVVTGEKKIETRSWNTNYRGELYIHASKKVPSIDLCTSEFFIDTMLRHNFITKQNFQGGFLLGTKLPYGAIIGKVDLIDVVATEFILKLHNEELRSIAYKTEKGVNIYELTDKELAFGDYSENRYCWLLSNPVLFDKPIPAKGKLMLWNYDLEDSL